MKTQVLIYFIFSDEPTGTVVKLNEFEPFEPGRIRRLRVQEGLFLFTPTKIIQESLFWNNPHKKEVVYAPHYSLKPTLKAIRLASSFVLMWRLNFAESRLSCEFELEVFSEMFIPFVCSVFKCFLVFVASCKQLFLQRLN